MSSFEPDWVSPPGATIQNFMHNSGRDLAWLASAMSVCRSTAEGLLTGAKEIDEEMATALALSIGTSKSFWLTREQKYRAGLGDKRAAETERAWLRQLPVSDLVRRHLIDPNLRGKDRVKACLNFFGTDSLAEWHSKYSNQLGQVAFRTSGTFDSDPFAVLSWLRCGEIASRQMATARWDHNALADAVHDVRRLVRVADPELFLPALTQLLGESGVVLTISPNLKGCRASGATFFSENGRPVILLSFRHLADDHFWFTLFHEIGHLLLHSKSSVFVECRSTPIDQEEKEANEFSENILIPADHEAELVSISPKNPRQVLRFAKKAGVSPGVIIGQLQHRGVLRHDQFNRYKKRFKWESNTVKLGR